MKADTNLQSLTLEEYEPQISTCVNCFCGICIHNCPAYAETKNEALGTRGVAQICAAILSGELEVSELSDEIVHACTGCRWCEVVCSQNTPIYIQRFGTRRTKVAGATMREILRSIKVERGEVPEAIKGALDNMARVGNPYGNSKAIKDKWVEELGCKFSGEGSVLYVGSMVPYEDRSAKAAQALIEVLKRAGIKFSMLGSNEQDSGALARYMGEEGLFEELVAQNSKLFRESGIKQIICVSPHDYDAFLNYYDLDNIDIKHYVETLLEAIKDNKLELKKRVDKRVTYHDACYLGRRHNIYEQPREILKSIPGIELIEMDETMNMSYCCGGGGTGLWCDLPRINMNYTRVDHAKEKNVDYLIVACPGCLQMLDDGMKFKNYDVEVKDIAQVVLEAL